VVLLGVDGKNQKHKIGSRLINAVKTRCVGIVLWSGNDACEFYVKQGFSYNVNLGNAMKRDTHETIRSKFMCFALKDNDIPILISNANKTQFKIAPVTEEDKIILYESLANAMNKQHIMFNDDLQGSLDSWDEKIQIAPFNNAYIYREFKKLSRQGIYAPLVVVYSEELGYHVKATKRIEPYTLISEYSGCIKKFNSNSRCDSIMHYTGNYVIMPNKCGNLGKYISGVNELKKGRQKANLKSIRYVIDGQIHVLLYTLRIIKKEEILQYKYNDNGKMKEYPTGDFK
jgi:hypothetical protein